MGKGNYMNRPRLVMFGVREYAAGFPVELTEDDSAPTVTAWNEWHGNCTHIDVLDLLKWVIENRPEMLERAKTHER